YTALLTWWLGSRSAKRTLSVCGKGKSSRSGVESRRGGAFTATISEGDTSLQPSCRMAARGCRGRVHQIMAFLGPLPWLDRRSQQAGQGATEKKRYERSDQNRCADYRRRPVRAVCRFRTGPARHE